MKRKSSMSSRPLGLESLESRDLMAGVVTVQVSGGNLRITGDGVANGVLVFQLGEGQYRVVGTNHGGSLTRVRLNNALAPYQTVSGVNNDAIIDMRGGGDKFTFSHTPAYDLFSSVPNDLRVLMGDGDDEVYLSQLKIGDDLFVDLGNHSDTFQMINSIVGRDDGTDLHNVEVFGQAGIDTIRMYREGGEMLVRGDVLFDAGATNEQDNISLTLSHVLDDVMVRTHGGGDYVTIRSAQIDDVLTVETGNGTDDVDIFRVTADEIYARLGLGNNDWLGVRDTSARLATLDGGPGSDDWLYLTDTSQFTNQPIIVGFEL